jgi:hypothetical protein
MECDSLRVQVIQLEKGAPERFPFCGTLPRSAIFGALETENRAFCEIFGGKKEPRDLIFCHVKPSCRFGRSDMAPPPLVSIQRGTTPAPRDLSASSANTTAVGASSTTAAALAAIRPDDVSVAASDADICHIVVLTNGFILSAKSAGMDELHFRSHFDGNRQVRCASGKKCGNPHPVEESSHRFQSSLRGMRTPLPQSVDVRVEEAQ